MRIMATKYRKMAGWAGMDKGNFGYVTMWEGCGLGWNGGIDIPNTDTILNSLIHTFLLVPVETLYQSLLPNLPQYMIALLKILLAAAPTSKAKTDSINILADVLPEEMPTTVLQSMKLGGKFLHGFILVSQQLR